MFNEIQETGKMKRTTRKIYQVEMNADSIQEQDYLFFLGLLYSSTKLDQEMLQCRAELPRKKKSMLLLACIITSNIEILGKGYITPQMMRKKNLLALYPSVQ